MAPSNDETYSEIAEILSQYRAEVPKGHRPWPGSIRDRVELLWSSGVRSAAISRRTGLPYYTVLQWRKARPRFVEVPVRRAIEKVGVVTTPTLRSVSVVLPSGIRIEGLDVASVVALLPALGVSR